MRSFISSKRLPFSFPKGFYHQNSIQLQKKSQDSLLNWKAFQSLWIGSKVILCKQRSEIVWGIDLSSDWREKNESGLRDKLFYN
jgi:hypothetical protein